MPMTGVLRERDGWMTRVRLSGGDGRGSPARGQAGLSVDEVAGSVGVAAEG